MVFSKSLASLRHRPSHANVRSTTHRRGSSSKPSARSDRLTISSVNFPTFSSLPLSFGPAYPPSAKICRSHGHRLRMVCKTYGALSVLNARRMDHETNHQAESINHNMALATVDLLPRINLVFRRFPWFSPTGYRSRQPSGSAACRLVHEQLSQACC